MHTLNSRLIELIPFGLIALIGLIEPLNEQKFYAFISNQKQIFLNSFNRFSEENFHFFMNDFHN